MDIFSNVVDKTFSIAVAAFLLLRMEQELRRLRAAIDRLRHCQTCIWADAVDLPDGETTA